MLTEEFQGTFGDATSSVLLCNLTGLPRDLLRPRARLTRARRGEVGRARGLPARGHKTRKKLAGRTTLPSLPSPLPFSYSDVRDPKQKQKSP